MSIRQEAYREACSESLIARRSWQKSPDGSQVLEGWKGFLRSAVCAHRERQRLIYRSIPAQSKFRTQPIDQLCPLVSLNLILTLVLFSPASQLEARHFRSRPSQVLFHTIVLTGGSRTNHAAHPLKCLSISISPPHRSHLVCSQFSTSNPPLHEPEMHPKPHC